MNLPRLCKGNWICTLYLDIIAIEQDFFFQLKITFSSLIKWIRVCLRNAGLLESQNLFYGEVSSLKLSTVLASMPLWPPELHTRLICSTRLPLCPCLFSVLNKHARSSMLTCGLCHNLHLKTDILCPFPNALLCTLGLLYLYQSVKCLPHVHEIVTLGDVAEKIKVGLNGQRTGREL